MKFRSAITQEKLKSLLRYSPETGIFTRRIAAGGLKAGSEAGCINSGGYVLIGVDGIQYTAHRLAWLYVNGTWPTEVIDHINGDCADNRIANLREASCSQNAFNRSLPANSSSGLKGVNFHKATGRWRAQCYLSGKQKHLGLFDTPEEAHEAYCLAAQRSGGRFFNDGTAMKEAQ